MDPDRYLERIGADLGRADRAGVSFTDNPQPRRGALDRSLAFLAVDDSR